MCWEWLAIVFRPLLIIRGTDATTQTEKSLFQRCDACHAIFDLDGDESLAGDCGVCKRHICYLCNCMLAWDHADYELKMVCDHCRDEFLIAVFTRKFDIHKICEK